MHVREYRDRKTFAHKDVKCIKQMFFEIFEIECRKFFFIEIRNFNNRTVNISYLHTFSNNTSLFFENFTTYE